MEEEDTPKETSSYEKTHENSLENPKKFKPTVNPHQEKEVALTADELADVMSVTLDE